MTRSNIDTFTELSQFELDETSIRLLPLAFCRTHKVVVLGNVEQESSEPITLGMVEPENRSLLHHLARMLQRPVRAVRLNQYEVEKAIQTGYRGGRPDENVIVYTGNLAPANASIPEILNAILADAVAKGASDIHIESYPDDVDLRYRIDGILHQIFTRLTPQNVGEIISRIKIISGLDITERRKPLDGRFQAQIILKEERLPIDFRVSIVPTPENEDVVLRVLDSKRGLVDIEQLGMPNAMRAVFKRLLSNPEGLVLVTGPTGSGKTTTIYAALSYLSNDTRKIVTAEDPIEYRIDKLNQKQPTPHMSLKELMKSLLRQDPDIMLFGEIRDHEMGDTALMAAATGHVVLSSLHTDDALGAITRLRGIQLENTDIANALLATIGQRLVRRVCTECRVRIRPNEGQAAMFGELLHGLTISRGRGCKRCHNTGYKGRIGLYEMIVVDEGLQELIAKGAHKSALRLYTLKNGFRGMVHDGLSKVNAGLTTLEELLRVLPYRQLAQARKDLLRRTATLVPSATEMASRRARPSADKLSQNLPKPSTSARPIRTVKPQEK